MKILYIRTLFALNLKAGGSVGHTSGVIHALSKIVSLDVISNDELADVQEKIRVIRPWITRIFPQGVKELICNLQFILMLNKSDINYDAIYHRHAGFAFVGAYFSNKYNIPLILEFNSSEIWKLKNWKKKSNNLLRNIMKNLYHNYFALPVMKKIEKYNLNTASLIVVVSEVLKEDLIAQGIPEYKILVNPNGVNVKKFFPFCGGEKIRKRYGLDNKIVIGFIGTFGQWHGVKELAQAIIYLIKRYPDIKDKVKFLLVGDGILLSDVKKLIESNDWAKSNVIFTGLIPQEDAPFYLDACDIFISPHIKNSDGTKFFGSPTKLFEYMAMSKGIVASSLEQIEDILVDGKTAIMVNPGDIQSLADKIYYLVKNSVVCERLGRNARIEVLNKYTWDIHVKRILDKFKELVKIR